MTSILVTLWQFPSEDNLQWASIQQAENLFDTCVTADTSMKTQLCRDAPEFNNHLHHPAASIVSLNHAASCHCKKTVRAKKAMLDQTGFFIPLSLTQNTPSTRQTSNLTTQIRLVAMPMEKLSSSCSHNPLDCGGSCSSLNNLGLQGVWLLMIFSGVFCMFVCVLLLAT